ncbi:hypothetical protein [Paracoccus mutanolyticus]|uniref:hypothetical protein n=1 Tax=Paracoccus mutanolyticus TaxID=1499308 RepID=UPI0011AEC1FC|nr:hypothetical protein [Paracoccus mutanolyticus]
MTADKIGHPLLAVLVGKAAATGGKAGWPAPRHSRNSLSRSRGAEASRACGSRARADALAASRSAQFDCAPGAVVDFRLAAQAQAELRQRLDRPGQPRSIRGGMGSAGRSPSSRATGAVSRWLGRAQFSEICAGRPVQSSGWWELSPSPRDLREAASVCSPAPAPRPSARPCPHIARRVLTMRPAGQRIGSATRSDLRPAQCLAWARSISARLNSSVRIPQLASGSTWAATALARTQIQNVPG